MTRYVGKQGSFRFLWFGQILANLGDILYVVCLIKIIFDATGSVTFMSLVPFCSTFSGFVSGLTAPVLIQKYNLKWLLCYSQSGKILLLFVLCIFVPVFNDSGLWFVFLLISFLAFLDGWAAPVRNALVPNLVEESKLLKTNSLLSISDQIVQLIAWPIGSTLMVPLGVEFILWSTFGLFVCAAALFVLIQPVEGKAVMEEKSTLETMIEGWMLIWTSRQLKIISFMNILETFANGVWIAAILFVFVSEALNKGENWWGFINGSFFAGMLLGGLFIYQFSRLLEKNLGKTILWSTFCLMMLTILFGTTSIPLLALLFSLLFGLPQMAREVAETTIFQQSAREQLLAKVYSARSTMIYASFGISSLVMGWIAEQWGVRVAFIFAAGLFLSSFFIAIKHKRELMIVESH